MRKDHRKCGFTKVYSFRYYIIITFTVQRVEVLLECTISKQFHQIEVVILSTAICTCVSMHMNILTFNMTYNNSSLYSTFNKTDDSKITTWKTKPGSEQYFVHHCLSVKEPK
jgi:hypothetical protein